MGRKLGTEVGVNSCFVALIATESVSIDTANYLYHCDCIRGAFGVSNQCLSQLRKATQIETSDPTELVQKQEILSHKRFSDVVLPRNCEQPA